MPPRPHWSRLLTRFYPLGILLVGVTAATAAGAELIPAAGQLKTERPRLLLRPRATPYAISLDQLTAGPSDAEFQPLLTQLTHCRHAAALALVWRMTGDTGAAERAIARMRAYRYPGQVDTFHIYLRLTEFALAYDWLYDYPGLTDAIKAELRAHILPLAQHGIQVANDHMFHNYVWMSAGGAALWALATAGDDQASDKLLRQIRQRFNTGLLPAWKYLDGLPSEPMGYWALYVYTPGVLTLLAAQSAFEVDLISRVRNDGNWLERHFENLIHSTLPNMRYIPWGDLQSGPNGGITQEMAGIIDATTWALDSPHGAFFSRWLKRKRGLARFRAETAILYMLYTRHLDARPETPPTAFLAGNQHGGHFIARSGWDDGATVVALTCTDHLGDHHHYDQGGLMVYRHGLLAVDPPVYRHVRGPQQKTENHNTLLLANQSQRPVRGQWFVTVEQFQKNLAGGRRLETGDILFFEQSEDWAAVACQFAQAYPTGLVDSCVRQLLFVRPGTIIVVDRLAAAAGKSVPEIEWLVQLPDRPTPRGDALWVSNGTSWLTCRPVLPGHVTPTIAETDVRTHRASFHYPASGRQQTLVHLLQVGDSGKRPPKSPEIEIARSGDVIEARKGRHRFAFAANPPFDVHRFGQPARRATGPP